MESADRERVPVVTILFIVVNVIIWLILELMGDTQDSYFMIAHGAAYEPLITKGGEFYRLFTCMFLHFGADHLMNNMLVLGVTGMRLESVLGSVRFAALYLCAGLGGSLLSLYHELGSGQPAVSAGASGAVFGVIGALLAWAVWHKGKVGTLTAKGLLGMAALSLYYGFSTSGVDNWGHIGGMAGGIALGSVFAVSSIIADKKKRGKAVTNIPGNRR